MEFLPEAEAILDVWRRLKKSFRHDKMLKELRLNEVVILHYLSNEEEINQKQCIIQVKDLSEQTKISRPALNEILNRLEHRMLIERFRIGDDRKSVYVRLGKNAYSIYHESKEQIVRIMNTIVTRFGLMKTKELIQLLQQFTEIIEEEVETSC